MDGEIGDRIWMQVPKFHLALASVSRSVFPDFNNYQNMGQLINSIFIFARCHRILDSYLPNTRARLSASIHFANQCWFIVNWMDPCEQISVKLEWKQRNFHSRNYMRKCNLKRQAFCGPQCVLRIYSNQPHENKALFPEVQLCSISFDHQSHIYINTLRPRQNGRHFADDIFKCIFLNENVWISIRISLKFVPKGLINNIPALVQIMAWRRPGDKPLFEPMMASLLTHICVTRPQWANYLAHIQTDHQSLMIFSPSLLKNQRSNIL